MSERARLQQVDHLLGQAFGEAEALGFSWVGPEDFVLAILAPEQQTEARAALEHVGITHETFSEAYASSIASLDPPIGTSDDETGLNPAAYELMGRAEGLAIGLGAPAVTSEHVLIAYLWSDSGELEGFFGVTREAVLERLAHLGVKLPDVPLPPPPRLPGKRIFVPYDGLMSVVGELMTRLPRDSGIGFNHDGVSRAWVSAYPEIDLPSYVSEALDDLGLEPVSQPENA